MTAAQFRVPTTLLENLRVGDTLTLTGPEAYHAVRVLRLAVGEPVRCADGAGRGVAGVVHGLGVCDAADADADADALIVRVTKLLTQPRLGPSLVLVQALAKGGRDELAVEAATELGVDEVLAWQAERSVVRWREERAAKSLAKWQRVVAAAAKQARRLFEPPVYGPAATADVARRLASAVTAGGAAYVLHEEAPRPLAGRELPERGDVVVVVGPEGGITAAELAAFTEAGATPVRLGDHVLRTSTAGPAALAVLSAAGRWRDAPPRESDSTDDTTTP